MIDFLTSSYLWIKALHIISVIAWMAGLLYLPRLFVYHVAAPQGSDLSETLKTMERRLLRFIMNPAMGASFIFGLLLCLIPGVINLSSIWFHLKTLLILGLAAVHGMMAGWRKDFEADRNQKSALFFRVINEVPTLLMIGIVILVVVKPF
jgi:putative membrane protein